MHVFRTLLLALLWALVTVNSAPVGFAQVSPAPLTVAPAPAQDGSVMFILATVEGERIELRQTRTADGRDLYDARPIIEALRGMLSLDETVLTVERFQDGARLSIDMADGKVEANGQTLGMLPEWEPRTRADTWLDSNAIAILTGTQVGEADDGTLSFTLDDRLRPQFDLELWVEGQRITVGDVEPRTIGPVLLLPLRDVVEALGHALEIDEATGYISVIRIQDTSRLTIDPSTGAVALNDQFIGVSPSMSYAEPDNLLFPSPAIETLTGTHIKLRPGTNRVDITLDDRLGGGVLPDAYVLDQAEATPFTFERLDYQLSTQGQQTIVGHAHAGTFNGTGRVRTAGGFSDPAALQPSAITIDVESLRGWRASLGDINSQFRELSGAGTSRVRGANWRRQTEDGDIVAVAAGVPLSGSRRLSDSASLPTFSGMAAGARLIRPDRNEEIGISAASEAGESRLVASAQKFVETNRPRDKAGLKTAQASVDVGVFQGGTANAFDVDAQASGSYRLSNTTQVRAQTAYRGASFLARSGGGALGQETTPSSRTNARVSLDWRATRDWTILKDVGAGARIGVDQSGSTNAQTISVSVGGRIPGIGPNISADLSQARFRNGEGESGSTTNVNIRMFKRFGWGDGQVQIQSGEAGESRDTRMVATLTGHPVTRFLGKDAVVSLAPTASVVSSTGVTGGRLGATLTGDSGAAFGDRFRMGGQFSAAQSLNPDQSAPEIFANLSGSYYVNRYIQLTGSVGQNFSGGTSMLFALRGSAPFNPPRKHTLPQDGRGVLKGRAFLDRNRDGVRQADEPGIPGIVIGLDNTRLRLGADRDGFFTIQNLKSGLYSLGIDRRTLPLGFTVADNTVLRATVAAGQITNIDVPVIASGQIRGAVFVDVDRSGDTTPGDERLEGAYLTLTSLGAGGTKPQHQYAASFGQFAFENVAPGPYRIQVAFGGRTAEQTVEISEEELLVVQDIAFGAEPMPDDAPGGPETVMAVAP
ncbi:MAG: hypothetical protein AAF253_03440 [Pseudomonadota bacterium]